ncbi:MAG: hypothetical protein WDM71_02625 [Ferruginibacter sp.]
MRGRVLSFYAMAFFGMQPLGGLIVGLISQHIGVENTVLSEGIIALLIGIWHIRLIIKNKFIKNTSVLPEKKPIEIPVEA